METTIILGVVAILVVIVVATLLLRRQLAGTSQRSSETGRESTVTDSLMGDTTIAGPSQSPTIPSVPMMQMPDHIKPDDIPEGAQLIFAPPPSEGMMRSMGSGDDPTAPQMIFVPVPEMPRPEGLDDRVVEIDPALIKGDSQSLRSLPRPNQHHSNGEESSDAAKE